jgi:histidyl-tRNA synthetase
VYPNEKDDISKQLKYANQIKVPFVIIAGPDEQKNNEIVLKNMVSGEQKSYNIEELISELK